jgi:uracil-DNA glycosylase
MMGQDPYPSLDSAGCTHANGIAFSTDGGTMTPSLRVIRDWLVGCYPRCASLSFDTTLLSWCSQGVLLINASLTVEWTDPGVPSLSHRKTWEATIRPLLGFCGARGSVVFVLMGSVAADYDDSIPEGNVVLMIEHPASVARKKIKDPRCDIFIRVNDHLMTRGREPINWTSTFS